MNNLFNFLKHPFPIWKRTFFLHNEIIRLSNQNGILVERLKNREEKIKKLNEANQYLNSLLDERDRNQTRN